MRPCEAMLENPGVLGRVRWAGRERRAACLALALHDIVAKPHG